MTLVRRAAEPDVHRAQRAVQPVGSALVDLWVGRGDRVGVLAYNTPEVVETWFGCEKHNLVRVVLHSHFAMDSHVWSLNHLEASALIFDTRFSGCRARQG